MGTGVYGLEESVETISKAMTTDDVRENIIKMMGTGVYDLEESVENKFNFSRYIQIFNIVLYKNRGKGKEIMITFKKAIFNIVHYNSIYCQSYNQGSNRIRVSKLVKYC
uniref:Uncharacterized protein n=1 Tax=Cacopsylla melanoneura TaxID=428564 RepID=A0A8D9A335_9HEMI